MGAISTAYSQDLNFGAKVNLGVSWIGSGNLKENLKFQMNKDADIREWKVNTVPGILIGLGATAVYDLNGPLSIQGELSFNHQQSSINIDYFEDDRDASGNGSIQTIESKAKISTSRIAVPVTLHYSLGADRPALLVGLEMNFLSTPKIESTETEAEVDYNNNIPSNKPLKAKAANADLDIFNTTRMNFLLGAGKTIEVGGNELSLQLKYHLPITSSPMNTSDLLYDDQTFKNNEVFGASGKMDAEQDAPGILLNDFKMSFIDFSISYFFN
jgi:hypothetical protein